MTDIRKFPAAESERVETGPIQFGDDWPGVFMRGDDALVFANALVAALKLWPTEDGRLEPHVAMIRLQLEGLLSDLESCQVETPDGPPGSSGWPPGS